MKVFRDIRERALGLKGPIVTLGTFDGLHRGHVAILDRVREVGADLNRSTVAVTYDPHPQRVLASGERAPRLLSTLSERLERFARLQIDVVVVVPFDRDFSRWTAERFAQEILVERLDTGHLVIGYDHAFGHDRRGKSDLLEKTLGARGIPVDVVRPVKNGEGPIKSSRIRRLLAAGELDHANSLLGYPYAFSGPVVKGDRRGTELGFPTANIHVPAEKQLPAHAIYGARAELTEGSYHALIHIGPRPTLGETRLSVEAHLLDFPPRDLYGETVTVIPEVELRKVEHFASLADMVAQMHKDRNQYLAYTQRKEKTRASE